MTNPDRPDRKSLWVTVRAHADVSSMQKLLRARLGYPVTQSEAVTKGMAALRRELEESK